MVPRFHYHPLVEYPPRPTPYIPLIRFPAVSEHDEHNRLIGRNIGLSSIARESPAPLNVMRKVKTDRVRKGRSSAW